MINISEAIEIVLRETHLLEIETVELTDAKNRILAEDIFADMDLPPFDRSQMDGYAVIAGDTENAPVKLKIIGESAAGSGFDGELKMGEAVRIMTGAPVPKGADAVQRVEVTKEESETVEIFEPTKTAKYITKKGSETENGAKVFSIGEQITKTKIAALAAFGYAKLKVFQRPNVKILATGNELVKINETPDKDQIRESNSIMLKFFAEDFAETTEILPRVGDDIENLRETIAAAAGVQSSKFKVQSSESKEQKAKCQVLILTGGVSVGKYDFTKTVLEELGAEIFFEKIELKPGKPAVFARLNGCLIFGLPGNPVSAAVTFHLFARTAILKMQSAENAELKRGIAVLKNDGKGAKGRDSFLPAMLGTNEKGELIADVLRWSGSSNFISFARAESLVFIPRDGKIESGETVEIAYLN